jgi:hypothetical protein
MNYELIWSVISTSKEHAIYARQIYNGKVKFYPSHYIYPHLSEHEFMFSYALAKFQNLVIFDE